MRKTERITWHRIEDGLPESEGLYLVTRYDGQYRAVIVENLELLSLGRGHWDGDPCPGGPRDGDHSWEGPVVAWAELPVGYAGQN